MRVRELAEWLGSEFEGDGHVELTGVAPIESAGARELSFINSRKAAQQADASEAGCLIAPPDFPRGRTLIRAASPRAAFARAIAKLYPAAKPEPGIHSTAVIANGARIGDGVSIGPHVSIGEGSELGSGVAVGAG